MKENPGDLWYWGFFFLFWMYYFILWSTYNWMMRNAFLVHSYIMKCLFFTVSVYIDLKIFEDELHLFIFFFFEKGFMFI